VVDLTDTIKSKSSQLNADEFFNNITKIITVRKVVKSEGDQPTAIFFDGDDNKPYKPCLTMRRALMECWGNESDNYLGKSIELYRDSSVTWGGDAVGGIRIKAVSHIDKPITKYYALNNKKKIVITIGVLTIKAIAPSENQKLAAATKAQAKLLLAINDITDIAGVTAFLETHKSTIAQLAKYGDLQQELLNVLDMKQNQFITN
jgi:hypothetical protein